MKGKFLLKKIRYFFETIAFRLCLGLFYILGPRNASNFGSFLARHIGKLIPVNKLAKSNISQAFPDLKENEVEKILDDMWDNLGRISGEFVHCCKCDIPDIASYVEMDKETAANLEYIKKNYNGGIIFSAHIGNWEVGPKFFMNNGINAKSVYRPLNNEAVDDFTAKARNIDLIPKSSKGSKQIISEIKKGSYIIIMADQKVSDGIEVPFFHKKALTTASIAKLALRYGIPLIPTRLIRIGKEFKFRMEVDKAIEVSKSKTIDEKKVYDLTKKINEKIESWVRQYPAQWFWVHNRWKR